MTAHLFTGQSEVFNSPIQELFDFLGKNAFD